MTDKKHKNIKLLGYASLALTVLFIISMVLCTFVSAGRLDIYVPEGCSARDYKPEHGLVKVQPDEYDERHLIVIANGRCKEFILNDGEYGGLLYVMVLPGGIIFDETNGNFSGWKALTAITVIYIMCITVLLAVSFILRCRHELFSYTTLFFGGMAFFLGSLSLDIIIKLLTISASNAEFSMMYIYSLLKNAGCTFIIFGLPIFAVYAIALAVSNISLVRREGRSFVNLLGLILSGLIVAGYMVAFFLGSIFARGSEKEIRIFDTVTSFYYTAFSYFEIMLLSSSVCGIIAARKKTLYNKTHVIILGCAIAADGTPLPLLRGRIDRAIEFARTQENENSIKVKFVPSGGKGSDEVIAEAESIRNYLILQGISEDRILLENKSTTTQENMRFSQELINADSDNPRIVFSTSGYHVLRSGIISRNEGLDAEGIGCKVKWYFFPNAFVREFVGLLASKWKQHAFWMVFFIIMFAAINMIMPL